MTTSRATETVPRVELTGTAMVAKCLVNVVLMSQERLGLITLQIRHQFGMSMCEHLAFKWHIQSKAA